MSYMFFFFFFKQKTAYEMRISDWSSDVCSSDLVVDAGYTDKTIRIENAQPAMMKLNDAFLAQRAQNAVHMDERKCCRITDMLLGERQIHLLDAVAWPLRLAVHQQFQNQAGNELARIERAHADTVIRCARTVASHGARLPQRDEG